MGMSQENTMKGVKVIRDLSGQLHDACLEILNLTIAVTAIRRADPKFSVLTKIVRKYNVMALRYMLWTDRISELGWLEAKDEGLENIQQECSAALRTIDQLPTCISTLNLATKTTKAYYDCNKNISSILFELYTAVTRVYYRGKIND